MAASFRKAPVLESLFNSDYCKIFKGTYFEEDLWKAASENEKTSWNWEKLKIIHTEL